MVFSIGAFGTNASTIAVLTDGVTFTSSISFGPALAISTGCRWKALEPEELAKPNDLGTVAKQAERSRIRASFLMGVGVPPAIARRLPLPPASSFSFWRAARRAPGRHDSPRGPSRLSLSGGDATPVAYAAQSMLRRLFWWSGSCVLPAMIERQRSAPLAANVSPPERFHP